MTDYTNRRFVIFDTAEKDKVNYDEVYETAADTLRLSVDGTKTFVEYDLPAPEFVQLLQTKSQEYTYEEILEILNGPDWSAPIDYKIGENI